MSQKMTDEEAAMYQQIAAGDVAVNEDLLREWTVKSAAHIAAVTAELDMAKSILDEVQAITNIRATPGELMVGTVERISGECDTLRERVKVLEASLAAEEQEVALKHAALMGLDSRLAAIRTTARTLHSMSLSTVMSGEWDRQASAFTREMAGDDTRPRAPPEAYTHEKGLDAGVFDETQQTETTGCCYQLAGGCKAHQRPEASASTTSEAFATLWDEARNFTVEDPDSEQAKRIYAALSLLERRMGAMARALRLMRESVRADLEGGPIPRSLRAACKEADAALTDAPPVFTLEAVDIERACEMMHDAYEKAAKGAGWETQERSRRPWAEVPEANKTTMRAAVSALLQCLQK